MPFPFFYYRKSGIPDAVFENSIEFLRRKFINEIEENFFDKTKNITKFLNTTNFIFSQVFLKIN